MDTSDEWIMQRSGIKTRYGWARVTPASRSRAKASKKALDKAGLARATSMHHLLHVPPDHFEPGNGVFLQRELGPPTSRRGRTQSMQRFITIVHRRRVIRTGQYKNILLVAPSAFRGLARRRAGGIRRCCSARRGRAVLGPISDDGRGVLSTHIFADGRYAEKLWVDGPGLAHDPYVKVEMLEQGLIGPSWRGATSSSSRAQDARVRRHRAQDQPPNSADVKLLVPHQATSASSRWSRRPPACARPGLSNIQKYGNTTAASFQSRSTKRWQKGA